MNLKGRSFLKLLDYTPQEILYLLDLAADLKDKKKKGILTQDMHRGKNVALIFEKTSTRTRCTEDSNRKLWRSSQDMPKFPYGTALPMSSIPPRCLPTC